MPRLSSHRCAAEWTLASVVSQVTGPEGWAFEPAELDVEVGVNGQCNGGDDINFRHTGFSLSGQVQGRAAASCGAVAAGEGGPRGMRVIARAVGEVEDSPPVGTAVTDGDGRYLIRNLPAGRYVLAAVVEDGGQAGAPVQVELGGSSVEVPTPLVVEGYRLQGRVMVGSAPVPDVEVCDVSPALRATGVSPSASASACSERHKAPCPHQQHCITPELIVKKRTRTLCDFLERAPRGRSDDGVGRGGGRAAR
jgi:hypothetical protein